MQKRWGGKNEQKSIDYLVQPQEVSMMGTCIFITYYGMRLLQKKET